MTTMTTTTRPTFHPRPVKPVCDHCANARATGNWQALGWHALDDGAQLCQACWLDVMHQHDPAMLHLQLA